QGNVQAQKTNDLPDGADVVGTGHTHGNDANTNLIFDKSGEVISDKKAMALGIDNVKIVDGNNTPSPLDETQTGRNSRNYGKFEADYTVTPSGLMYKTTAN